MHFHQLKVIRQSRVMCASITFLYMMYAAVLLSFLLSLFVSLYMVKVVPWEGMSRGS